MNREALQESLSAVMDNEADELELRRVLACEDPAQRAQWARYQVARAAMHRELLEPRLDLAAAVSAAIADEVSPKSGIKSAWRSLGRVAVAASVTVAVLAGVRFYNQETSVDAQLAERAAQPVLMQPQAQSPAVLAGYSESTPVPAATTSTSEEQATWYEQRLPGYMQKHAEQAGAEGPLPYARAASLEER
jgi:sigma-E factor negative regulatory protein RseA